MLRDIRPLSNEIKLIVAHSISYRKSESTPVLMLSGQMSTDDAARACEETHNALKALLEDEECRKVQQVIDYLEADSDPGCKDCWFSSSRNNIHEECDMKIKRWFSAREELVKFGEEIAATLNKT